MDHAPYTASLIEALRKRGLDPAENANNTVTVTANGIEWHLVPYPNVITGRPCGVWSAVGPVGSRGMFTAANAAEFVDTRTTP